MIRIYLGDQMVPEQLKNLPITENNFVERDAAVTSKAKAQSFSPITTNRTAIVLRRSPLVAAALSGVNSALIRKP
ncbi:hypothetical protein M1563_00660 [Patescibacteria group bacterium]|nr:hypothetical protein [Patescibacteria group bacterium]MCL5410129.1 hypothetical protein [Patescibacteria group bacterium]